MELNELKKIVSFNKKFIIILLLLVGIVMFSSYSYALYQINFIKHNVIVLRSASNLNIMTTIDDTESDTFTLPANGNKTIVVHLDTDGITSAMAYKMYYELTGIGYFTVSSTETFTDNKVEGIMQPYERTNNEKITGKNITLTFTNNSSNALTIKLGAIGGYEKTGASLTNQDELLIGENNTYIVSFDGGNLIYGLNDTNGIISARGTAGNSSNYIDYSVNNGEVTVINTGLRTDGDSYGLIEPAKVYFECGKTYIFNCETDGVIGYNGDDTVEVVFGLDGYFITWYRMDSFNNYEFTPQTTGEYWLRIDVNAENKTYKFWNITVKEKINSKKVAYEDVYGSLPTPTRNGYTFMGWNGKNLFNLDDASAKIKSSISDNKVFFDGSDVEDNRGSAYVLQVWNGESYVTAFGSIGYVNYSALGRLSFSFNSGQYVYDHFEFILNTNHLDPRIYFSKDLNDNTPYTFSFNVLETDFPNARATINNIQLEQESSMTEYEPYYITSSVTVTQKKDHILKAIWKQN